MAGGLARQPTPRQVPHPGPSIVPGRGPPAPCPTHAAVGSLPPIRHVILPVRFWNGAAGLLFEHVRYQRGPCAPVARLDPRELRCWTGCWCVNLPKSSTPRFSGAVIDVVSWNAAPLVATAIASKGGAVAGMEPWRATYFVVLGIDALNAAAVVSSFSDTLFHKISGRGRESEENSKVAMLELKESLKSKALWLISISFFLQLGAMMTTSGNVAASTALQSSISKKHELIHLWQAGWSSSWSASAAATCQTWASSRQATTSASFSAASSSRNPSTASASTA